jgi:hypothetical protein
MSNPHHSFFQALSQGMPYGVPIAKNTRIFDADGKPIYNDPEPEVKDVPISEHLRLSQIKQYESKQREIILSIQNSLYSVTTAGVSKPDADAICQLADAMKNAYYVFDAADTLFPEDE